MASASADPVFFIKCIGKASGTRAGQRRTAFFENHRASIDQGSTAWQIATPGFIARPHFAWSAPSRWPHRAVSFSGPRAADWAASRWPPCSRKRAYWPPTHRPARRAASQRRRAWHSAFPSQGQAGRAALHGRRGQPYRPVRLQARAGQAPRPAVRFRRAGRGVSKRPRPVAEAGLGISPLRPVRQDAQRSRRAAGGRASTTWRSSTTWSARPACTVRARCCRPPASIGPAFPAMGCWVSYGLGSMNDNLPTFVVLPDHRGLRLQRHQELGHGVSAGAASGHGHLSRHGQPDRRPVPGSARRLYHPRQRRRRHRAAGNRLNREHAAARAGRSAAGSPHPQLRTGRPDADSPRPRRSTFRRSRPTSSSSTASTTAAATFDKEINAAGRNRLLWPQMPGRPPAAGAGRALRADLVRQRQRLSRAATGIRTKTSSATTARWPTAWPAERRP